MYIKLERHRLEPLFIHCGPAVVVVVAFVVM